MYKESLYEQELSCYRQRFERQQIQSYRQEKKSQLKAWNEVLEWDLSLLSIQPIDQINSVNMNHITTVLYDCEFFVEDTHQ
jgi:hypothetical protein